MPIAQMQSQAQRMQQIIAELMELSRLESAGRAGTRDVVDVAGLIASSVKTVQSRGTTPAIRIEVDRRLKIRGNGTQIESVVTNLVSNAARHTPEDGSITVRWEASGKAGLLSVEDTGEGIAAEHIPRLTERFFRVDRGRSRDDGGVGLGLAIVKHILSRHDANLSIESTPGVGSVFRCEFPKDRLELEESAEAALKSAEG